MTNLPEGSWTVFGLPRSHWHAQLNNFEWSGILPPSLPRRIVEFTEQVTAGKMPHLILTGDPGIGKSHLGVGLYRWAALQYGTLDTAWLNVPKFCREVKSSYGTDVDPFQDYVEAKKLVVLDDLFGRELSSHEIGQIVYNLIDVAYMNGAAVVVTMNQSVEELTTFLRPHEVSRILMNAQIIPMFSDQDRRR